MDIGNIVRLKTPVIQGEVTDIEYDKTTKALRYLVNWANIEGEMDQRWFSEADLELISTGAV